MENDVKHPLSERLLEWRGRLRQKEAADKLNIPLSTYRKYENGQRTPGKLAMSELERRIRLQMSSSIPLSSEVVSAAFSASRKA